MITLPLINKLSLITKFFNIYVADKYCRHGAIHKKSKLNIQNINENEYDLFSLNNNFLTVYKVFIIKVNKTIQS